MEILQPNSYLPICAMVKMTSILCLAMLNTCLCKIWAAPLVQNSGNWWFSNYPCLELNITLKKCTLDIHDTNLYFLECYIFFQRGLLYLSLNCWHRTIIVLEIKKRDLFICNINLVCFICFSFKFIIMLLCLY